MCASLRTVPRWINKIWYNLRTVPSQWTISDGGKWNLTPASIENTHTHGPWVVALCRLCLFFGDFVGVLSSVNNSGAVMNVQFSLSVCYDWLEEYVCSSGAAHMPGVLLQLRESFTCLHTHTGVHAQFCQRNLELSLADWMCSWVEASLQTARTQGDISATSHGKIMI